MKFSKRLLTLFSALENCNKFADVGCDHGYCTEYMLKNNFCEQAVISDISAESLKKAQDLLAEYLTSGKVLSVCCDGLDGVPRDCDLILIAGMGGEEIISILKRGFLPEKLLLQPMKNSRKVREFLILHSYEIIADFTFKDGKFYDLIKAVKNGKKSVYSEKELEFGRDNLKKPSADFFSKLCSEMNKKRAYLSAPMREESEKNIAESLRRLEEVYHEVAGNI